MKTLKQAFKLLPIIALISLIACTSNSDSPQLARMEVRLTDAPNPEIKEVWVDIKDIQINTSDTSKWISLKGIYPGIYNLLSLTDGKDTLLADAQLPAEKINQLRLVLGSNNYLITKDGKRENLNTPSGLQSGLKVQIHQELTGGVLYRLILDFDAARSIVSAGNNAGFNLKPVLRVLSFKPSGGIAQGVVLPETVTTAIYAIQGLDTIASTFSSKGEYRFYDIPGGSYSLHFHPQDNQFLPTKKELSLEAGQVIIVDTVRLELK